MPSSSVSWKSSSDGVSGQFPAGLRVLVVDDDPTCLMIFERMLRTSHYEATKCNQAEFALSLLRENRNGFDIVISDVHMPDMDGFKLLEYIGLEMDLPVIMMSADDSKDVVMNGVTHGACDYLIKPVRIEALRNIWQHVVRKRKHEFELSGSVEDGKRQQKLPEDADYLSSGNDGNWVNLKRKKDEEEEADDRDDTSSLKKPRIFWTVELHQQFLAAANQLGIDKAVPKKILDLMNVPGLTRENVASHLQKYRLYLRRLSGQHQNGLNSSFMGTQAAFLGCRSNSSLNGLDLQAFVASGRRATQSLATLHAAALGRSTSNSSILQLLFDERNIFSFGTPESHFLEGPQQHLTNNCKQVNFLHGNPVNMQSKQHANVHQTAHPFGGMHMQVNSHGSLSDSLAVQIGQPQARAQIQNGTDGSYVSRLPSSIGRPVLSNGITNGVLGISELVDNVKGPIYGQASQASSMVDTSANHSTDLSGNSFPVGGNLEISCLGSKGVLQEEASIEMKGSRGEGPSYGIFSELHQQKSQDWGLHNVGLTSGAPQQANMQVNLDASLSVLIQPGFSSQNTGPIMNSSLGNGMFSCGEESNRNTPNFGQHLNAYFTNDSLRINAEILPEASYENSLLPENYGQEDLMSALFKLQEGAGEVENEFGFDGYPLDNLPS